jgi:hypothetical protein
VRWAALALAAAGCAGESERVSLRDCEALLAHLTVLEQRDWGRDGPLCKYHPSCDGRAHRDFLEQCPKVVEPPELRCYRKATSLTEAEACGPRAELDERIQSAATGAATYGGDPAPWLGAAGEGGDRRLSTLTGLRERACACTSAGCSEEVAGELDAWKRRHGDPESKREIELDLQIGYCLRSAPSAAPDAGFADPYAYRPDAAAYFDPYSSATGIAECDELLRQYEKMMNCSYTPQSSRDAMRDSLQQMKDMYRQMTGSSRDAAADACKQGSDAMADSLRAMGC